MHKRSEAVNGAVIDALTPYPRQGSRSAGCHYLTSIANRPLIAHVADSIATSGVGRIYVLGEPKHRESLLTALRHTAGRVDLKFVEGDCNDRASLVRSLPEASGGEPAMLHSGDCLFPDDLFLLQERFDADGLDLAVLVTGEREGGLGLEPSAPFGVRLPRQRPQGTAVILASNVWPILGELVTEPLDVPRLAEAMSSVGCRVGQCEVGEHWCYHDQRDQLLAANRMLLDALPFDAHPPILGDGNTSEGRVSVSPTAQITHSTLRGPVMIGENAIVEDSFIGPYTAVGPAATVIGAEIDYTMVLTGAEVRYPGSRLEASVIGERAVVRHSLGLPAGMHLGIGPDAHVMLG